MRGLDKVRAAFIFAMAAYNIVRLPKLMATRGEPSQRHEKPDNHGPTSGQNLEHEPRPPAVETRPPAKNRPCTPRCANAVTFSAPNADLARGEVLIRAVSSGCPPC